MADIKRDVFGKGAPSGRVDEVKFWVEARKALTAKEYIAYELHIRGESKEKIAVQMGEYIEDVGLMIESARVKMKKIANRYMIKTRTRRKRATKPVEKSAVKSVEGDKGEADGE